MNPDKDRASYQPHEARKDSAHHRARSPIQSWLFTNDGHQSESLQGLVNYIWLLIGLVTGLCVALCYLSDTSLYRIRGSTEISLDIVLMLTPWGLLQSFIFRQASYLRPFYFEQADRYGLFQDPSIRHVLFAVWVFAATLLFFAYRIRSKDKKQ